MTTDPMLKALEALDTHPPALKHEEKRNKAFLDIAAFLEQYTRAGDTFDLYKVNPNPIWELIAPRLARAVDEIGNADLASDEVWAWQMYNDGVIVKSGEAILGLDIFPMPRYFGWEEPAGLTESLAALFDVLVISHEHQDHYDKALVRACLNLGKPVILPEALARDWENNSLLHFARHGWSYDVVDTGFLARQGFHVWRDTMEELPLVYYEITCRNGFSFIFGGDVDCTKVFENTAGKKIDLLFLPWRNPNKLYEASHPEQIGTTLDGVKIGLSRIEPAALLYQHYAELDHVYEGLPASYDIALDLKRKLGIGSELMFWGEKLKLR